MLAVATMALLSACTSSEPLEFEPPPGHDTGGDSGQDSTPVALSAELESALRDMDCTDIALTSAPAPTDTGIEILQAGRCIPFAGVEQVEFFEFTSADDARTWIQHDGTSISGVDNAYISGPVIIIDRNNDYLMQMTMQFDTVS